MITNKHVILSEEEARSLLTGIESLSGEKVKHRTRALYLQLSSAGIWKIYDELRTTVKRWDFDYKENE